MSATAPRQHTGHTLIWTNTAERHPDTLRRIGEGAAHFEAEHLAVLARQDVGAVRELRGEPTCFVTPRLVLEQFNERVSEMRRR